MRTALSFLAGVLATLLVVSGGGYLLLALGWFPIGADNAPGTLERRLARTAHHAYMAKHVPRTENPVQPTPANLAEGAREYEEHCAVCHGGARQAKSVLRTKFSPPVPQLVTRVPHDPDPDFFWITKHGIRMTGMPAWDGILSDDQIWKVVSFLKHSNNLPPEAKQAWQAAAGLAVVAAAGAPREERAKSAPAAPAPRAARPVAHSGS